MANMSDALAFSARGPLKIYPLPFGEKRPRDSFPELATDDPVKITLLWRDPITGSKEYNIGVLCGSGGNGLIIIDIDTKYDAKFKRSAIANYEAIGGHFNTLVVKTASGGLQAYFWLPKGMSAANMQSVVPGIDIRCENGYGIGPGSFALESGGGYEIYNDAPIANLPASIIPLLKPVRERKERLNGHADSEKAIPLYIDYLRRVEPAIEGQGGDNHTYNVACMGIRDYGLSEPTTTLLMLQYFNPRCIPPWDADELRHKVENAESYAIGEVGSRDPDNILNGHSYKPPVVTAPPAVELVYRDDIDDTLMKPGTIPLTDWLVHPLLIKGEVTTMIGPGGVGKSAWMIALGCHAAVGKSFGPFIIREPFECMLYNPEDSRAVISGRADVTCSLYNIDHEVVRNRFKVFSQNNKPIVLVEMDGRKMRVPPDTVRFLSEYKNKHPNCKAMFFDPMRKMFHGINENDNAMMSEAMGHMNAISYTLELAVLISHHTVKNLLLRKDYDPDSADLSVGAGSVSSSARIILNVLPQSPADIAMQGRQDTYFSTRLSKNSNGPTGKVTWWSRRILRATNGQEYPTPMVVDIKNAMHAINTSYIATIGDHMLSHNRNTISVAQASLAIADVSIVGDRSPKSLAETLRILFHRGNISHPYTAPDGRQFSMVLETTGRSQEFSLIEVAGIMPTPVLSLAPPEPEAEQ